MVGIHQSAAIAAKFLKIECIIRLYVSVVFWRLSRQMLYSHCYLLRLVACWSLDSADTQSLTQEANDEACFD